MSGEDFDMNWIAPPRPFRPLPQVAKLTAERDELRAKLVKAVIYIARMWMTHGASVESIVNGALDDHGIRLRWTGDGFEEDKG